jgi:hypothetical protein
LAANGLDSGAAAQLLSKLAELGRGQQR